MEPYWIPVPESPDCAGVCTEAMSGQAPDEFVQASDGTLTAFGHVEIKKNTTPSKAIVLRFY